MITSRMIFRIYLFGLIAARVGNRDTNGLVDQDDDAQSTQHKNSTVTRRVNREANLIEKKHAEVGHFTGQVTGGHDLEVLRAGARPAPRPAPGRGKNGRNRLVKILAKNTNSFFARKSAERKERKRNA